MEVDFVQVSSADGAKGRSEGRETDHPSHQFRSQSRTLHTLNMVTHDRASPPAGIGAT